MLRNLRIQNFALIDRIELSFNSGYTVITGETGSGKSILLSALNLILGERADFSVIGPQSDKAIVEADFEIKDFDLEHFFNEHDLDFNELTLIRREINSNGKSRAFINDTPVALNILKELTCRLVNIHSQYNTLELKSRSYQLDILDTLADLKKKRNDFGEKFKNLSEKKIKIDYLKNHLSKTIQQSDYNKFQLEELEELNLEKTDFGQLEIELKKAENSEGIILALNSTIDAIDSENSISDKLRLLLSLLDKVKNIDGSIREIYERLNPILIELKDISAEANSLIDSIEINPERLQNITNTLNRFYSALKKHNKLDQTELIEYRNSIENEILGVDAIQNEILKLDTEWHHLNNELIKIAEELHHERKNAIKPITVELQEILEDLKLPQTKLEFQLVKREEFNQFGATDVILFFSANKGIETVPIEKAASGGELSRVMLALQKMVSEKKILPTVLFDEIDTGVSGEVAQKIGNLLQKMGNHFQLIAISHLPQVAAKASHHLKVEKHIINERTVIHVNSLEPNIRVEEIARLMSGDKITEAAIETAKALMN